MRNYIQLPKHQTEDGRPVYASGIYIIQMLEAIQTGYPKEWKHSHLEWIALEEYGLIKIGITRYYVFKRVRQIFDTAVQQHINHRRLEFFRTPIMTVVGFARAKLMFSYEQWIHRTLHAYRIPKQDMPYFGKEWFIPTPEVLGFLRDVILQLENEGSSESSVKLTCERLARIRQSYFGGILIEPTLDKTEYARFLSKIK